MSQSYDIKQVIVTVQGGVVTNVEVPEGVVVVVKDYDADEADCKVDEHGCYVESTWESPE